MIADLDKISDLVRELIGYAAKKFAIETTWDRDFRAAVAGAMASPGNFTLNGDRVSTATQHCTLAAEYADCMATARASRTTPTRASK